MSRDAVARAIEPVYRFALDAFLDAEAFPTSLRRGK